MQPVVFCALSKIWCAYHIILLDDFLSESYRTLTYLNGHIFHSVFCLLFDASQRVDSISLDTPTPCPSSLSISLNSSVPYLIWIFEGDQHQLLAVLQATCWIYLMEYSRHRFGAIQQVSANTKKEITIVVQRVLETVIQIIHY